METRNRNRRFARSASFAFFLASALLFPAFEANAAGPGLQGTITDTSGKPVSGAEVFVYTSPQVRRTADFISAPSDGNGVFSIVLPEGTYWVLARLRKTGPAWGPLMPGDQHSGAPVRIRVDHTDIRIDFTLAGLKDAARLTGKKTREDYVSVRGRIIDAHGGPVPGAYAIANKTKTIEEIPDYLSSWTDGEGGFVLYLRPGNYFLGSGTLFPPGKSAVFSGQYRLDRDITGMDIIRPDH